MNNNDNEFHYTYSATEQAELKKIREKYLVDTRTSEPDKMEQIRRLDASVTERASIVSLVFGIIGTLVMGFGMSLIMTDFRDFFSMSGTTAMLVGIIVGVVGMLLVLAAYPLYQRIAARQRKRVAPEILKLTEEVLKGEK